MLEPPLDQKKKDNNNSQQAREKLGAHVPMTPLTAVRTAQLLKIS
jgi:hypothetical protein